MENWKVEIKRLDSIREKLGLNFNQIQKLTGIDRAKIGGFFNMKNQPSLGFYLTVKGVLEKEVDVYEKVVSDLNEGVSISEINKKEKKGSVPKMENPPPPPQKKSETTCDCRMDGLLFIRGKSGCKKTKDEHKF